LDDIANIPESVCKSLEILFTDIDGTITLNGRLPAESYAAIWRLNENGIEVVPVTGRPAGWCDLIARMWPVRGVIGENGAFYFSYNRDTRTMERRFQQSEEEIREGRARLGRIEKRILSELRGCAISADQAYRATDLAIDYREDVAPSSKEEVERICDILRQEKVSFKISDIHVNCWYGDYDKVSCIHLFLQDVYGKPLSQLMDRVTFVGDSPNDEPMFKALRHSIGVANLKEFFETVKYFPAYLTSRESAMGFVEAVDTILRKRGVAVLPRL
jgi:HAD superfamily hydrolase (TIGR01484 family)